MSDRDINILYVTSNWPCAPSYGGQLRVLNIGRQLKRLGNVSLVIASSEQIDQESLERTRAEFEVRHIARVTPDPMKNFRERLKFELDPLFLNTHFSSVSRDDRDVMLRMMREHDVIWVHGIRTANEFQVYRWPHTVLDIDDIPSQVYTSRTKTHSSIARTLLDYRMLQIWRRRERLLKDRFTLIAVCSENDRRYLGDAPRIHVIRNGFDRPAQVRNLTPMVPVRIGFIGLFKYSPNRIGIEWFIRNVWPLIKRDVPDVRLRLVGLGSDQHFQREGPDIDGLGFVEDPTGEIATWSAMIVPIRFGGGTRVKIAEAFSRRCPVVSTSVGAFGYEIVNGEDVLLANDPHMFAAACLDLIRNPQLGRRIAANAWEKFVQNWTWDSIGPSVTKAIEECVLYNKQNEPLITN